MKQYCPCSCHADRKHRKPSRKAGQEFTAQVEAASDMQEERRTDG